MRCFVIWCKCALIRLKSGVLYCTVLYQGLYTGVKMALGQIIEAAFLGRWREKARKEPFLVRRGNDGSAKNNRKKCV